MAKVRKALNNWDALQPLMRLIETQSKVTLTNWPLIIQSELFYHYDSSIIRMTYVH